MKIKNASKQGRCLAMPLTCTPSAVLNSGKRKQYKAPSHKQTILPGERVHGGVKFDVACLSRALSLWSHPVPKVHCSMFYKGDSPPPNFKLCLPLRRKGGGVTSVPRDIWGRRLKVIAAVEPANVLARAVCHSGGENTCRHILEPLWGTEKVHFDRGLVHKGVQRLSRPASPPPWHEAAQQWFVGWAAR